MQRNTVSNLSNPFASDQAILMINAAQDEGGGVIDNGSEPSQWIKIAENSARFAGLNLTGMGLEYMACQAGIIATNPELYQSMFNFAAKYYLSPMACIGRSLIWGQRALLAVAYRDERPENLKEIAKTVLCDLVATGFIGLVYWGGSSLNKHDQLLIEIAFIDTFVTSMTSSALRFSASKVAECSAGINWRFWRRGNALASINMDVLGDSPPTPTARLVDSNVLPSEANPTPRSRF